MSGKTITSFSSLPYGLHKSLPQSGFVEKSSFTDAMGSEINILTVCNGLLAYTVLLERGLDIGEIYLGNEKVSWDRSKKYLLHPENVNLVENGGTGWVKGFYPAVASIGPELFGTPGEGYTLHGSGSYSPADTGSVVLSFTDEEIVVEGVVHVEGPDLKTVFEKKISIKTYFRSPVILREETTRNMSDLTKVLDDGLHIQLTGHCMDQGGRYVLPVKEHTMLIRDSAPQETDPFAIYPLSIGKQPIRCYQYVPEPVSGLEGINELKPVLALLESKIGITAEMIYNIEKDTASFVVRPLDCFPRSLIAKEIDENALFSFEPCRTRPNRMSQKITDGEAFFLPPKAISKTQCIMGVTKDTKTIAALEKLIRAAAGE